MVSRRELGDLAAELVGIEGTVETLSLIVQPKRGAFSGHSNITQEMLEGAFYHISSALERIADDLSTLESEYLKARAQ
jgi:hypothetical protein